jgi:hypothetical protein
MNLSYGFVNTRIMPSEKTGEIFRVKVSMIISNEREEHVDSKTVDFGSLKLDQLRGLTDLFSALASNVEYIKKLAPQYERLSNSAPPYLC